MSHTSQDFKKILNNAKLKSTEARIEILRALTEASRPETAQEIYKRIKNKIDIVTLYRALTSFEKNKLVKKVNLQKDAVYYESNNDHHHHIVCSDCGIVEDFENKEIEKALGEIVRKSLKFKNIKEHSLELFGFCKTCA